MPPETTPQSQSGKASVAVMQKWTKSCALCHIGGVGGAPRVGFAEEWHPRLLKGKTALLKHTIEGFNNMPPLGYCMSCEEEDFVALIDFMLGESP
jgi:cytochrome c5